MGYYWVTTAQHYIQHLGFGSSLPPVNQRQIELRINQYGGDNSFFRDDKANITLGKGGVDDAEDAEVIVHEYGHSVQDGQVAGFGTTLESGVIGEVHADGEIWSRALWDIRQQLGDTKAGTLIIDAQFAFTPDISFRAAAQATVATAQRLYGAQAAQVTQAAFTARGILDGLPAGRAAAARTRTGMTWDAAGPSSVRRREGLAPQGRRK